MKTLLTFIISLMIMSVSGQSLCDTAQEVRIFTACDIMPSSNITLEQLADILNQSIDLNKHAIPHGETIFLSFAINCRGEAFDYRFRNLEDEELENSIINIFKSNLVWTPGMMKRENKTKVIEFLKYVYIVIENNQFKLYSDNPKANTKKGKKKK
jgi:hypothetical protein